MQEKARARALSSGGSTPPAGYVGDIRGRPLTAMVASSAGAAVAANAIDSLATVLVLGVARKKGQPIRSVEVLKTGSWMTPLVLCGARHAGADLRVLALIPHASATGSRRVSGYHSSA